MLKCQFDRKGDNPKYILARIPWPGSSNTVRMTTLVLDDPYRQLPCPLTVKLENVPVHKLRHQSLAQLEYSSSWHYLLAY